MKRVALEGICNIVVGKTPARANYAFWGDGNPWLSIADMTKSDLYLGNTKEEITDIAVKECNCRLIPKNTVLLSFKLSIGKVGITQIPLYTNEAIAALIVKNKEQVNTKYLYYALKGQDFSIGSNRAVMGQTLNKAKLNKLEIPLPSMGDQKRIVRILDEADALRQKRKQAIELLDDYLKSVFLDMFGDPVKNPKGWKTEKLKNLTSKIGSGATPRGGKTAYINKGISLIRSLNVHDNEFLYKNLAFINEKQAEELSNVAVEEQDVLLNITGASVCRCALVPKDILPARVNQHVSIIRANELLRAEYLLHLLISKSFKRKLLKDASSGGATREALTKQQLEKLEVMYPPIDIQNQFIKIVHEKELLRQKMVMQSEELETQFQALMQRAFNG